MKRKIIENTLGIIFYSIGLNMILLANFGVGAFDTIALVIQQIFNITKFGNALFFVQMFFAITLLFFKLKKEITLRSIFVSIGSIFLISQCVNIFRFIQIATINNNSFNLIIFISGFLILCLGITLISIEDIVISPFDKVVVELSNYEKRNIGFVRLICDLIILLIAVMATYAMKLDVKITIATLVLTFITGPVIIMLSKLKVLRKR